MDHVLVPKATRWTTLEIFGLSLGRKGTISGKETNVLTDFVFTSCGEIKEGFHDELKTVVYSGANAQAAKNVQDMIARFKTEIGSAYGKKDQSSAKKNKGLSEEEQKRKEDFDAKQAAFEEEKREHNEVQLQHYKQMAEDNESKKNAFKETLKEATAYYKESL